VRAYGCTSNAPTSHMESLGLVEAPSLLPAKTGVHQGLARLLEALVATGVRL
jgi:hypothetical protein